MYKINKNYINRFSRTSGEYLYKISNGIYLAFDSESLEYIGIELFYLPYTTTYEKQAHELLNTLLSKDILEYI